MNILGLNKEQKIISLFRRGDAMAMDKLYACYADYLTGVCSRYISEEADLKDVLQESFIKIFTQINTFEYRGVGSLKAWLVRIVVNESLLFLRKKASERMVTVTQELPDCPEEELCIGDMNEEVLLEMIQRLPAGYRTVFNLYVIEGKSHKEIADILNIKADSSASQFHRAKQMMVRMVKDYRKKNQSI